MKTMKKLFASLLVLCMVLTLPNMAAYAADEITLGETITTDTSKEGVTGEYQYTATEDGVYKVELISVESTETTTRVVYVEGDVYAFENEPLEIVAYKDDVLNFKCEAYSTTFDANLNPTNTYGTGKFVWKVTYEGPVPGTSTNPEELPSMEYGGVNGSQVLTPGGDHYYYKYTVESDAKMTFQTNQTMDMMFCPEYDVDIIVKHGDKTYSLMEDGETLTNPRNGSTYNALTIDVKEKDEIVMELAVKSATGCETFELGYYIEFVPTEGSKMNPIALEVTEEVDFTEVKPATVTVPAGTTMYYTLGMDFSGMLLVVEGTGLELYATDMMTGQMVTYPVTNGVAEAPLYADRLTYLCKFAIKNTGSEAAEYKVYCDTIEGTVYAPEVLEDTDTQEFEAGDGTYYYVFTATEDGYIKVQVSSTTEWFFYVENATTEERSENHFSNNDEMEAVAEEYIKVSKDDEIIIAVMAFDVEKGDTVAGKVITTVTYTTPDEATVEGTIGDIEASTAGSEVEIDILDKDGEAVTVVPEEIFAAAKDKDVDLLVKVNALFSWLINGKDITSAKDLDLAISDGPEAVTEEMIKAIAGEGNNAAPFVIAHDGELGLKATLKVQYDPSYADEYANLFYYNPTTKALEFVCVTTIGEKGVAEFNFTHASEYVLVVGEDLTPEDPDDTTTPGGDTTTPDDDKDTVDKLGDLANPMIYVIVLLGAALVGAGFVAKKRFA